jgi:hypothetical protein
VADDNKTVVEARRALANAYTLVHSIEGTRYLRGVSFHQLVTQSIRQLGAPGETQLDGSNVPTDPPIGTLSRRDRLIKLRSSFKDQLGLIRALPAIVEKDPELRDPGPDEVAIRADWA